MECENCGGVEFVETDEGTKECTCCGVVSGLFRTEGIDEWMPGSVMKRRRSAAWVAQVVREETGIKATQEDAGKKEEGSLDGRKRAMVAVVAAQAAALVKRGVPDRVARRMFLMVCWVAKWPWVYRAARAMMVVLSITAWSCIVEGVDVTPGDLVRGACEGWLPCVNVQPHLPKDLASDPTVTRSLRVATLPKARTLYGSMMALVSDSDRCPAVIRSIYEPPPFLSSMYISKGIPVACPETRTRRLLESLGLPVALWDDMWHFHEWRVASMAYFRNRKFGAHGRRQALMISVPPLFRCTEEELLCDILNVVRFRYLGATTENESLEAETLLIDAHKKLKRSSRMERANLTDEELRRLRGDELRNHVNEVVSVRLRRRQSKDFDIHRVGEIFNAIGMGSKQEGFSGHGELLGSTLSKHHLLEEVARLAHMHIGYESVKSDALFHLMNMHVDTIIRFLRTDSLTATRGQSPPNSTVRPTAGTSKRQRESVEAHDEIGISKLQVAPSQ